MLDKIIRMSKPLTGPEKKILVTKLLRSGMSLSQAEAHMKELEEAVLGSHKKEKQRVRKIRRKRKAKSEFSKKFSKLTQVRPKDVARN